MIFLTVSVLQQVQFACILSAVARTDLGDSSLHLLVGEVLHGGTGGQSLAAAHTAWQLTVVEKCSELTLAG